MTLKAIDTVKQVLPAARRNLIDCPQSLDMQNLINQRNVPRHCWRNEETNINSTHAALTRRHSEVGLKCKMLISISVFKKTRSIETYVLKGEKRETLIRLG